MTQQLVQGTPAGPLAAFAERLPPMIAGADDRTAWRFVDFFAVTIRNPNTREAYYRAVSRFMDWCEQRGLHRPAIRPIHVAAYVEQLPLSRPSVRQHLSAISRCFDWMVSGGTLEAIPATSVQRPRHVRPHRQDTGPQRRPGPNAARIHLDGQGSGTSRS